MPTIGLTMIEALAVAGMLLAATPGKTPTAATKPVTVQLDIPGKNLTASGYPADFHTVTSQYATSREAYAATQVHRAYFNAATRAAKDANLPH